MFHITIKDLETGEIIRDHDTDAIIGSIQDENGTAVVVMTNCDTKQIIQSIFAAERAAEEAKKAVEDDAPEGFFELLKLLEKINKKEEDSDADTNVTEN